MPYSGTVGSCGDCLVGLRVGGVATSGPNCLTPRQEADGQVRMRVAQPLSEVVLDIAGR